jgi:hypothetical protein
MKRATGIILLFVFMAYMCGIEVFYSFRINAAKKESLDLIDNQSTPASNITALSFNPEQYNNLNWLERNKEFTYNGNHYDIIGLEFYSDEIKVTCYDDSRETSLVNEFEGFMKKMFSPYQKQGSDNNDMANKLCKEYLPMQSINPLLFFHVVSTIKAECVLVNSHALIADIWHPPLAV